MPTIDISPDVSSEKLASLALSIHQAIGRMPVVIKSKNHRGIIVEDGVVYDADHESKTLDQVFNRAEAICLKTDEGKHAGQPMFASAILDHLGQPVAAIGIIDTFGLLNLKELMDLQAHINDQLHGDIDEH